MEINVHVHHDAALQAVLEQILCHLKSIDCGGISQEDRRLLEILNARADRQTRRLEKLDAQTPNVPS